MPRTHHIKTETVVYTILWIVVISLYVLDMMRSRAQASMPLADLRMFTRMAATMTPYLALFLVNNSILIPRLLMRNRITVYFMAAAAAIIAVWSWQYFSFMEAMTHIPEAARQNPRPFPRPRPIVPLPVMLDFIYALLVVGGNLAISLMFQRYDDRLEKESLLKANAENRLSYLKAQINPHTYLNMLNNIHGMIELDPAKAQSMVIDMSQLMRYMLYESSRHVINLADEIAFIKNYLNLMRQRFPENKVGIHASFPSEAETKGIYLPPLLFLVFIENAFKHGVSYRRNSFVDVNISLSGDKILFRCVNSHHKAKSETKTSDGIGLHNVTQRLQLIYGSRFTLDIDSSTDRYSVNLSIPAHETANTDN